MHEMFIAFAGRSYVRPSVHLGKDESLQILRGRGRYVFFETSGAPIRVIPMGDYASSEKFYCRIPEGSLHALLIDSEVMTAFEATGGPFRPRDTLFPGWAPAEGTPEAAHFLDRMEDLSPRQEDALEWTHTEDDTYVATDPIVAVGRSDLHRFAVAARKTGGGTLKLLTSPSNPSKIVETFVIYSKESFHSPFALPTQDSSIQILEGTADLFIFDHTGSIVHTVPLGHSDSTPVFYCRIPANHSHHLLLRSDTVITHEVHAPIPPNLPDSDSSPCGTAAYIPRWAPRADDTLAIREFKTHLQSTLR